MRLSPAFLPPLLGWYERNKRDLPWRRDREPYHVWLSEIMLQQTRVEAVKGYYARFLAELPDIPSLAACDPDRLHKLVRNIICVLIARWQKNYMEMKRTVIGGLSINWKKALNLSYFDFFV